MKTRIGIVMLFLLGIVCTYTPFLYAQSTWSEVKVANILSLQFPPTLELRDLDNTTMQLLQNGVNLFMISRGAAKSDYQVTDSDVKEADALFKKQFADFGLKGSWYGTTRRRYGGKYALVSRYDRVGLSGDVHVEDYRFFLNNYIVEITLSYRKSEFDY